MISNESRNEIAVALRYIADQIDAGANDTKIASLMCDLGAMICLREGVDLRTAQSLGLSGIMDRVDKGPKA